MPKLTLEISPRLHKHLQHFAQESGLSLETIMLNSLAMMTNYPLTVEDNPTHINEQKETARKLRANTHAIRRALRDTESAALLASLFDNP